MAEIVSIGDRRKDIEGQAKHPILEPKREAITNVDEDLFEPLEIEGMPDERLRVREQAPEVGTVIDSPFVPRETAGPPPGFNHRDDLAAARREKELRSRKVISRTNGTG